MVVCVVNLSCTRAVYVEFKKLHFTPRKSQVCVQQKNSDATFFPVTAYLPLFLTSFPGETALTGCHLVFFRHFYQREGLGVSGTWVDEQHFTPCPEKMELPFICL